MSSASPTVSVVIPAYNAEKTIARAIRSARAQTVAPIEIFVVDDGSTDRTSEIVKSFVPSVTFIQQKNAGPAAARNNGALHSHASYLAFLDADDAWSPDKLRLQIEAFERSSDAVLCYTALREIHPDGKEVITNTAPLYTLKEALLFRNPGITPSCVLIRTEVYKQSGGFDAAYKGVEDWEFWLRMIQLGPFCAVDQPLTLYTMSDTGVSSNADLLFSDFLKLLEQRILPALTRSPQWLYRRKVVSYQKYEAALTARSCKDSRKELNYLIGSVLEWPSPFWYPKRFAVLAVTLRRLFFAH